MNEDGHSWQDRCDRYFTSISHSGNSKQNGHYLTSNQNGHTENNNTQDSSGEYKISSWKDLSVVRKYKKGHPLFRYIRNAVFKIDLHGTKFAGKSNSTIALIIWSIIILALFSFTIFLTVLQYEDYQKNKTYFRTRTFSNGEKLTSFPVLTVCNINVLKNQSLTASRFEFLINDSVPFELELDLNLSYGIQTILRSVLESNTKLSKLINSLNGQTSEYVTSLLQQDIVIREILRDSNESLVSRLRKTGYTKWLHDIPIDSSDIMEYGHVLRDVIVACFIGTRECKESSFSVVIDDHLGNCFTFSPDDNSQSVQLLLNAEADEYITGTSSAVGSKIILSQNGSNAVDGKTIYVGVNSFTSINIHEMKVITRQERSCTKEPSSKKQCLRACYKTQIRDYCECSRDFNTSIPMCRQNGIDSLVCRKVIKILFDNNQLGCNCQENCRETVLKTDQSTLTWPSSREIPLITSILEERRNLSFTENQIRNNLAKVQINLNPESVISVDETDEYEVLELLARFGGLFAFVVGMSVLTLLELLWTMMKSIFDIFLHIKNRSKGVEDKEKLSDSEITSVTWAMYKQKRRQEELAKQQPVNNERSDKKRHMGNGLGGNVNSRLHRRNSYLAPISENGHMSDEDEKTQNRAQHGVTSDRNSVELSNDYHQLYELKSNKYRVMNPSNVKRHADTNRHATQNYSEYNGSRHNDLSVIIHPYSSSVSYTGNRNPASFQNVDRWRYDKGDDRVHYGYTSAYFHTNISEPTFL